MNQFTEQTKLKQSAKIAMNPPNKTKLLLQIKLNQINSIINKFFNFIMCSLTFCIYFINLN